MAFEVVMPRLGWNMEEGTLAGWRKNDGDQVTAGEILFEVESDKALQEVEALENGILRIPAGSPEKGATVPVGTLLAWLVQAGESIPAGGTATPAAAPAASAAPAAPAAPPVPAASAARSPSLPPSAPAPGARHPAISPRAKRVARELGVDWSGLAGSGSSGRIVERDVRSATSIRAAASGGSSSAVRAAHRAVAGSAPGMQGSTAVTLTTAVDATEIVRLRGMFKAQGADVVPSYNDILTRIAALALQEHPECNVRFEGGSVANPRGAAVGIAVDAAGGLLTPVILDAQEMTLKVIARESARLAEQARTGGIAPESLRGSTLVIANLGMFEIDAFTPVIDPPECAVLGVGRIRAEQVVMDAEADAARPGDARHGTEADAARPGGTVAIRQMVILSLSFDHRLMESVSAARFLQTIKRYIEKPYLWLAGT